MTDDVHILGEGHFGSALHWHKPEAKPAQEAAAPICLPVRAAPQSPGLFLVLDGREFYIARDLAQDEAHYIAAAINSYAANQKREEALRVALEALEGAWALTSLTGPDDDLATAALDRVNAAIASIKEALK